MLSKQYLCKKKKSYIRYVFMCTEKDKEKTVNLCEYLCVYHYGGSRFVSL